MIEQYRNEYSKKHPEHKGMYWCVNCKAWVKLSEMKSRTLDDDHWRIEKSCPDCDTILLETVLDPDEDV